VEPVGKPPPGIPTSWYYEQVGCLRLPNRLVSPTSKDASKGFPIGWCYKPVGKNSLVPVGTNHSNFEHIYFFQKNLILSDEKWPIAKL